ncbi:MAG: DUF3598 family protein [Pseudomonadota bacterium]
MDTIRTGFPALVRHEGEWEGVYTHVDTDNNIVDQHKSHLQCKFPDGDNYDYYQINTYTWPDGTTEELHFPAKYKDGRIWWDTDRIEGSAWQIDDRTVMLTWTRKDMPGSYLYEMIQISEDNAKRGRTWHWFENDELVKRTCIKEQRVK